MIRTIFNFAIGGKIQALITIAITLVILATPVYLYLTYTNAVEDAKRAIGERDRLFTESLELTNYNGLLLIKQDSIIAKCLQDSTMYRGQIEDIQKILLQQKGIIKDKNIVIDEMKLGLKCKNFFGKIVDC